MVPRSHRIQKNSCKIQWNHEPRGEEKRQHEGGVKRHPEGRTKHHISTISTKGRHTPREEDKHQTIATESSSASHEVRTNNQTRRQARQDKQTHINCQPSQQRPSSQASHAANRRSNGRHAGVAYACMSYNIISYFEVYQVRTQRPGVGDIRLYDSGEVVRAEKDWLLKLLPAQHLQWDVHTLERHACDREAGEITRSRQKKYTRYEV